MKEYKENMTKEDYVSLILQTIESAESGLNESDYRKFLRRIENIMIDITIEEFE